MLSLVSFGRKASSLCVSKNGRIRLFSVLSATKNTAAIWCRRKPIRQTFYPMKRNITEDRRNLSFSKTTTSRLSPVSFLIRQTAFWMQNRFRRRARQNTVTAIRSLGKSNAADAEQAMSPDIRPAKTEADTRRGVATKQQTTADRISTRRVIKWAALARVSAMRMRFICCTLFVGS